MIRLLRFVKPYWKQVTLALILLFFMAAADLAVPRLLQQVIDEGVARRDLNAVLRIASWMVAASVIGALFAVGNTALAVSVAQSFGADVRSALFRRFQTFSFGNLDRQQTGSLMVRLGSDITSVQMLVMMSMRVLTRSPLLIFGSMILMATVNLQLALLLLVLLMLTLVTVFSFAGRALPLFRLVQARMDRLNNVLQENLSGVRLVKAFVRREHESRRFDAVNADLTEQTIRVNQFMATLMPTSIWVLNLGVAAVVWFGGQAVVAGRFTVGQVLAFVNYLAAITHPVVMLGNIAALFSSASASATRMLEVLDTQPLVPDRPGALELTACEGRVAFEDVCFSYNHDCSEPVLDHVSWAAEPGQNVAILGATGSGKTSLVALIPRFYDASRGRVTLDGHDVRDLTLSSLRRHIGVAMQETVLFYGSIRYNIAYGRPDATDEEVFACARAAEAHDFILALPQGYDTVVGERGASLSGGQKQRIAIARALLVRPKILILDDSTSAVDVQTETRIRAELARVAANATTFIIAQRISTVLHADQILVLERGQVVARGRHEELLATSDVYREIYESQLGSLAVLNG
jgi:ATP-binding cassette subfamily B protein